MIWLRVNVVDISPGWYLYASLVICLFQICTSRNQMAIILLLLKVHSVLSHLSAINTQFCLAHS